MFPRIFVISLCLIFLSSGIIIRPTLALKAKQVLSRHRHHNHPKPPPPPPNTNTTTTTTPTGPKDCNGVAGGTAKKDCLGKCNGKAAIDECGTCSTPKRWNLACADCRGVPNGKARKDKCGKCEGSNVCLDCHGIAHGKGRLDRCDVCDGDGKSCVGCDGVLFSGKTIDKCEICGGNNSCVDCNGVPHGFDKLDRCGKCGGTNDCVGCDGVAFSRIKYDLCDICGGDGSSCSGCDGVPGSGIEWDACGVCAGDNSTCCSPSPFARTQLLKDRQQKRQMGDLLGGDNSKSRKKLRSSSKSIKRTSICSGHGRCDPEIRGCACGSGWTGPYCQKKQTLCHRTFNEMECGGRGHCDLVTGFCICQSGWTGFSCDISSCGGNGAYDPYTKACVCYAGYAGEFCDHCAEPGMSASVGGNLVTKSFSVVLQHVCVPRSYYWLSDPLALAGGQDESTTTTAEKQRQNKNREHTYDLMALPKSKVVALLHKRKLGETAFLPNSTWLNGGFPGHIDCACRVNQTHKSTYFGMTVGTRDVKNGGEIQSGASAAAHAMIWNVMDLHAAQVRRTTAHLQIMRDMSSSQSNSESTATAICIAFSTISWVVALLVMGLVLLVWLLFTRFQSGGLGAVTSTLSSAGSKFQTSNTKH